MRMIAALALLLLSGAAHAQSAEDRATWLKSLKQPVTGMSCCDVSDCRAAAYRDQADGTYIAQLPDGTWTPVPREKVLDKLSIDGDAYLCAGPRGTVYCFVPPSRGM